VKTQNPNDKVQMNHLISNDKYLPFVIGISFVICSLSFVIPCEGKSVWNGNHKRNTVALTFDDGPKPEYCQPILDTLDRFGAKATFFVVGNEAEKNPDLVMRMQDSGHEVGNHTYSHIPAKQMSVRRMLADIQRCSNIIRNITKTNPKYFRPPGGGINDGISKGLKKMGLRSIFWTYNPSDYTDVTPGYEVPEDVKAMAEQLSKKIVDKVKPGTIILLHSSSEQTVRALPYILKALKEKGYGIVTVTELLQEKV